MSMTLKQTRTPGPWTFEKENDNEGKRDERIEGTIIGNGWHIARIWKDCDELEQQAEANARLIAAAPDLLAAIKFLLKQSAQLSTQVTYEGLNNRDAIAKARQAIARAEGKD